MKNMHLHHPSPASSSHAPTSQIQTSSSLIIVIPYVCVYTCVYKLLSPLSIARIYVCAGQTTRDRAAYVRASSWRTPTLPFSSP